MCRRLQPHEIEAATLSGGGCDRMRQRLQPQAPRASDQSSRGRPPERSARCVRRRAPRRGWAEAPRTCPPTACTRSSGSCLRRLHPPQPCSPAHPTGAHPSPAAPRVPPATACMPAQRGHDGATRHGAGAAVLLREAPLYLPYISPISPLYLPYISRRSGATTRSCSPSGAPRSRCSAAWPPPPRSCTPR